MAEAASSSRGNASFVPSPDPLAALIGADQITRKVEAAWTELKPTLERIVERLPARRVLEIGGGRHPFFSVEEARRFGFQLTVNDLDARELEHAPGEFDRLVLDIAQDIDRQKVSLGTFDLIFSRMVFEHVKDAGRAWSNVRDLLAPGGVGLAFVPTLYSPPFVINKAMPDAITGRLVRMLDRRRNPEEIPKFPAYYHACRASEDALRPFLLKLGFREVSVIPFFGTPYFPAIPILKHVAHAFDRVVERFDMRTFASYAYIVARA